MALSVTVDDFADLPGADRAGLAKTIERALAMARTIAPCLASVPDGSDQALAAEGVIVGAIKRWAAAAGGGGVQQESAGIYSVRYTAITGTFSDRDKQDLRAICDQGGGKAFALDTMPGSAARGCNPWGDWANPNDVGMSDGYTLPTDVLARPCEPMGYYGGLL